MKTTMTKTMDTNEWGKDKQTEPAQCTWRQMDRTRWTCMEVEMAKMAGESCGTLQPHRHVD